MRLVKRFSTHPRWSAGRRVVFRGERVMSRDRGGEQAEGEEADGFHSVSVPDSALYTPRARGDGEDFTERASRAHADLLSPEPAARRAACTVLTISARLPFSSADRPDPAKPWKV